MILSVIPGVVIQSILGERVHIDWNFFPPEFVNAVHALRRVSKTMLMSPWAKLLALSEPRVSSQLFRPQPTGL